MIRYITPIGTTHLLFRFGFSSAELHFQSLSVFLFNSNHEYCGRVFRKFIYQSQIISGDITLKFSHIVYMKSRRTALFKYFKPQEA